MNNYYHAANQKVSAVFFARLLAIVLLQLSLFGCEKPPTDAIIKAERLIEEARKAEADVYAKDIFLKAEKTLKATKEHIRAKEYKKAKASAVEVSLLAQEAIALAKAEKVKIREEAERMALDIVGMLSELRDYSDRQRNKQSRSKTNKFQLTIEQYQSELSAAKGKLQRQDILAAHSELKGLRDEVSQLKETLYQDRNKIQR